MKAVILAGGAGTRLRPMTFSIPKPLLPFREKPMLQLILEKLKGAGIAEVILATGYQSELIEAFCGNGAKFGMCVRYVRERKPLGTAGPLYEVKFLVKPDEQILLMNGDILTGCDFWAFSEFHRKQENDLTVGYTKFVYQSPFGVLEVKGDAVRAIQEKPSTDYTISAGIYMLRPSVMEWVPKDTFFTIPELVGRLLAEKGKVGAYSVGDFWFGMEHITHFEDALKELKRIEEVTAQRLP